MGIRPPQPHERVLCDLSFPGHEAMRVVQLYLMPAFFLAVMIISLPLNLLSLWIFFFRLKRWNSVAVHCCVSCLPYRSVFRVPCSVFRVPCSVFRVPCSVFRVPCSAFCVLFCLNWLLGLSLCKAVRLLYHNYFYLSIFFVTCVSLDRYLAIVHPLRSAVLLGRRQTYLLCAVGWAVNTVLSLPLVYMTFLEPCPGLRSHTVCTLYPFLDDPDESLPYSLSSTTVGFLFPLTLIGYCYLCSVRELRLRCRRPQVHLHSSRRRSLRLTRVLTSVLILFVIFYLPYHLVRNAAIVIRLLRPDTPVSWQGLDLAFSLEMSLCSLNTCVNALFSCFVGQQFKKELQDMFCPAGLWRRSVGGRGGPSGLFKRRSIQGPLEEGCQAVTPM
ncbi:hypothetical protein DPEC_G00159740 [Dallia pectoralis]|uniref:Uncharacterized protein n=1 Tax=Dallia pectoralis TaxID=75939 RepID=A0ACC2GFJ7_DALPE|nr:hypothetical protein DPEC_G00159740 [Dallia pectoralis]